MRSRVASENIGESRLMDTDSLRKYTGLGRDNAVKFGNEIGARVQFGRRVLWDKNKVDSYLDSLTED